MRVKLVTALLNVVSQTAPTPGAAATASTWRRPRLSVAPTLNVIKESLEVPGVRLIVGGFLSLSELL